MTDAEDRFVKSDVTSSACPLILHSSLQMSSFLDYLGNGFKIRLSSSTPLDSVILPSCGIAVLVVHLNKVSFDCDIGNSSVTSGYDDGAEGLSEGKRVSAGHAPPLISTDKVGVTCPQQCLKPNEMDRNKEGKSEDWGLENMEQLLSRIGSFMRGHRICVVLLVGSVFAGEDVGGGVMAHLQTCLMPTPPLILPAHGNAQVAMHIQILSKVCQSEMRAVVQARMEEMISGVIKKEHNVVIGRAMGLSYHQASVLMDSFGSVASVAAASAADIHQQTPLDAACAATVATFLARDTVSL